MATNQSKPTDWNARQISPKARKAAGVPDDEATRRAWANVNKDDGGRKKSGSGGSADTDHPAHRGGELGGEASASRPAAARSRSARQAATTQAAK